MNFPGIRIAQLAWLLEKYPGLFQSLLQDEKPWVLIRDLEISTSKYWRDHFTFGRRGLKSPRKPGPEFMQRLIINAVLPVHFSAGPFSGRQRDLTQWKDLLCQIPPEDNHTIRMWKTAGLAVPDAFYSQALLQLKEKYCKFKRCLSCYIGSQIIHPQCPSK
jgi:hypothetical protein